MELYLDTANIAEITELQKVFPIKGVTTNPSIIAKEKRPILDVLQEIQAILPSSANLFAQVVSRDADEMVAQAQTLRAKVANLIIKVPVTAQGLIAIKALTKLGIPTLGTAVYGAGQGFLSALAGATYVAPYVNRVDAQGGSGITVVQELQTLLNTHVPTSMILAASFRTPKQALDCLLAGCGAITLPTDVAKAFISDPAVDAAIDKFDQDWFNAFNRKEL